MSTVHQVKHVENDAVVVAAVDAVYFVVEVITHLNNAVADFAYSFFHSQLLSMCFCTNYTTYLGLNSSSFLKVVY